MHPFKKLTGLAGLLILMFCIPTSHASVMDINNEETIAVIKKNFALRDGLSKSDNLSPRRSDAFTASTGVASPTPEAPKSSVFAGDYVSSKAASIFLAVLSMGGVALALKCRQVARKQAFS